MRILVTNDDGIHAPGLRVMERIARQLSDDVWVIAPEHEQSGAAHSLTLTVPLRIRKIRARRFAVAGTPTDCVMLAVNTIIAGAKPDLILSGVNRGGNLGEDVTYSGTVAAAMEGAILNIPAIAMSQLFQHQHPVKWATALHFGPTVVRKLIKAGWPDDVLINVNFPDAPAAVVNGIVVAEQGRRNVSDIKIENRVDARGVPYYWIGFRRQVGAPKRHSDLDAIRGGNIVVTPLKLEFTHAATLKRLKTALS